MKRCAWLTWSLIALLPLTHGLGQEDTSQAVFSEPAAAAEAYAKAARDGRIDDAVALAEPGASTASRQSIEEFREVLGENVPAMSTGYTSEQGRAAMVLSALFPFKNAQPGGQNSRRVLFTLVRMEDSWVVKDVDIETKESSDEELAAFQQRYADAKVVQRNLAPPGPETKREVPSGQLLLSTSDVPDSVWDAPLPMFTDIQTVAVYYLAAVLADQQEHAATLTASRGKRYATQRFMAEFREEVEIASLRIERVAAVNNQALVVSDPVKLKEEDPDLGDDPRVIIALRRDGEPERQNWLITNVYTVPAASATKAVETLNNQVDLSKAPYRIRIGDQLCFGSQDDPMWDRTFTVQPDGTITLERLGPVWASGLTARELHDRVEEGFNFYHEAGVTLPPITVTLAKVNTGVATAAEVPPPVANSSPRAVAEAYVAAAREGRVDDALALVKPGGGNAGRNEIEIIGKNLGGKPPVLETVLVSQQAGEAAALFLAHFTAAEMLAEFTAVELPSDLPCRLLLLLSRVEDAWCVSGMEVGDKSAATELRSFQANHRDAAFDWMAQRKPRSSVDGIPALPPAYTTPPPQYQPYGNQSTPARVASSAVPRYAPPPTGLSSGLTSGELSTLQKTYEWLEIEVEKLAGEYHRVPVTTGPDAERIKETLKSTVAKAFRARQQLQRGELAAFRRRLDAIEDQIENRYRRESEIITHRVDELLDPNLKWDAAVDVGEARDAAVTPRINVPVPAAPLVDSHQFEIDAYFSLTSDSPTPPTDVATAGESVYLILDVTSPKRQSLTGLTVSIQLDDSLKPQSASAGMMRVGNQVTWQGQRVEANQVGRYAVECLCLKPMPSVTSRGTVTDAGGQKQSREVLLRINPGEAFLPPPGSEATDNESTPVPDDDPAP